MQHEAFVERVLKQLGSSRPTSFKFLSWSHGSAPTKEAFAIMPVPGLEPDAVIDAVMDVDGYAANISYVEQCRAIADDRFEPPEKVRFYQRLNIPLIGAIHHELVLHRLGERAGFQVAAWDILTAETDKLSARKMVRSDYNHGTWLVAPGVLGYGLGSAPRRKDAGLLKWKALTTGANVAAPKVLRSNLDAMARWAKRR